MSQAGGPAKAEDNVASALDPRGDLTWLALRTAHALTEAFNRVSRDAGLSDLRDWLVLALIGDETERTQLEIATHLGIDRSTLVPLLDRLEERGLLTREVSKRDRRARIPRPTKRGREVAGKVAIARDEAINEQLESIPPAERAAFHATLFRIVGPSTGPADQPND